jgi:hypothetical protein
VQPEEGLQRLAALGFPPESARTLWEHFDDAERRGKPGHGHSRIPWLETLDGYDAGFAVVDDGTDTLWDPPYVSFVPQRLQWALCMAISHAMWLARASYPWTYGENYVAFCRATGE